MIKCVANDSLVMFEELIMGEPCRNAACELVEKAPFLAAMIGSAIGGLIGLRVFFRTGQPTPSKRGHTNNHAYSEESGRRKNPP